MYARMLVVNQRLKIYIQEFKEKREKWHPTWLHKTKTGEMRLMIQKSKASRFKPEQVRTIPIKSLGTRETMLKSWGSKSAKPEGGQLRKTMNSN